MNKKTLTGLNATLIGAYSQLLHFGSLYFQISFDALPAIIGILAAILTYWTTLLTIWLNFPDISTFYTKTKIKAAIKRLEKREKALADDNPEKLAIQARAMQYHQLLNELDDREIQQLMTETVD